LLSKGEIGLGIWLTIRCTDVAELISHLGFDWVVLDMEHSPLCISDVQNLIQVIDETKTTPIVRVAWNDPVLVKLALDVGAHGILVPWVNTKEEAELAIKSVRYPPKGIRGYGPRRAAMYGLKTKEHLETADKEVMLIIQIETAKAVENLEEILTVEGIDAVFIGPYDLATSYGFLGDPSQPQVQKAINTILEICKKFKKPAGIFASPTTATDYIKRGFQFIAIGSDIGILMQTCKKILGEIKLKK